MKKVSGKKISVELNNMANNLNNNVRRVVKNDMAINLIRVLVILYTLLASFSSEGVKACPLRIGIKRMRKDKKNKLIAFIYPKTFIKQGGITQSPQYS